MFKRYSEAFDRSVVGSALWVELAASQLLATAFELEKRCGKEDEVVRLLVAAAFEIASDRPLHPSAENKMLPTLRQDEDFGAVAFMIDQLRLAEAARARGERVEFEEWMEDTKEDRERGEGL